MNLAPTVGRCEILRNFFSHVFEQGFRSQMFPALLRSSMKCERCGARIDYRFVTNCWRCGCEIKRASLPPNVPVPNRLDQPFEPTLTWKEEAINVVHIFVSSVAGLISGAVVVYFSVAFIYLALSSPPNPHAGCGWGSVIGFFSLVSGAFVGTVGGSVLAVKNPLCKGVQSVRTQSLV